MKSQKVDELSVRLRHTASHILAAAVKKFDPKVKFAIGPVIEDGFYYDFEFSRPFSETDLAVLENYMKEIIDQNLPVEQKFIPRAQALKGERRKGQNYKIELIEELPGQELSYYGIGDFWDLCKGPHLQSTGEVKAFKLTKTAGAYWRGSEHNPMLTRIYGTAFFSEKELLKYLADLELAKQRDHRKLGKELGLFTILPEVGSGLPIWLPKGATLYRLLEDFIIQLEEESGYQHVKTSVLGKKELYQTSGHLDHYSESMYPPIEIEGEQFILRPMNCPHHISLFASTLHSYRQLPTRIAEIGQVFRYEKSGELSGLQRVRSFAINDAHIFCAQEQIKQEIKNVIGLIEHVYQKLAISDYWFRLSLSGSKKSDKYINKSLLWDKSEKLLKEALKEMKTDFVEASDEAAFYGPKIDVQIKNIQGREESVSTVQLDFYLPERFDLSYIDEDAQKVRPVIIHRAIFGSMERFIGHLIEQTGGEFPFWIAPIQAKILPISEKLSTYARRVEAHLRKSGVRTETDLSNESLSKKIRQGELEKIPYLLIVGEKEEKSETVTIRQRHTPEQVKVKLSELTLPMEG